MRFPAALLVSAFIASQGISGPTPMPAKGLAGGTRVGGGVIYAEGEVRT